MKDKETDLDGMIVSDSQGHSIHTITIIGQIEGHQILPEDTKATKYEHLLPVLTDIEQNDKIDGVLILINTVGGDVEAGLAISELISGMKKPTVSLVLGGGHSIGVPLAVSAKKTFMAKTATMMVHPVRINGTVIGTEKTFSYFTKIQNRIEDFIISHSRISKEDLSHLMHGEDMTTDVGTILTGEQATKIGICDATGGLSDALDALHFMIDKA